MEGIRVLFLAILIGCFGIGLLFYTAIAYKMLTGKWIHNKNALFKWSSSSWLVPICASFSMFFITYSGIFFLIGDDDKEYQKTIIGAISMLITVFNFSTYHYAFLYFKKKEEDESKGESL